ncbi:MAG: response regulator [Rhodobacteraceae bacterium]|nr:response regulator [Paracoccaceae bacterium]
MTAWRRFFDRLLLAEALIMTLVFLVLVVSSIRMVRGTGQNYQETLAFYTLQIESGTVQLLDVVDRYSQQGTAVELQDVQRRFEILSSRVFREEGAAVFATGLNLAEELDPVLGLVRAALTELEPVIHDLRREDAEAVAMAKTRLRELVQVSHNLSLAAHRRSAQDQAVSMRNQLRQTYLTFAFLIGMAFFGVLSTLLLRADRRAIRRMNTELEDRVRKRTEDLQTVNTRLADEIAERKRNQSISSERAARLEQAAHLAKLGYYVWDSVEDRCEYCSSQHAAAHAMTPKEYIERASELGGSFGLTHPEDRERVRQKYIELRKGSVIEMAYRVPTSSGMRRLREIALPVFDERGILMRVIGSTLDVTDQYETEMKLFEAQRMDSIGKMTGGVAHDFNNLLAVILGNLELMREISDPADCEEMIEEAIRATLRGRDLTMSMLSFARRAPLDPAELNLNTVIAEMEGMLRRTLPENIALRVPMAPGIQTVMADRSKTESALLNLVINARDAMPGGGTLTIKTSVKTLKPADLKRRGEEIQPGDYVMLTVTDTGTGIRHELLDSVFEPFFTTKEVARNSGLGLSMVQGFIRQTGGAIRVKTKPGRGSTFRLLFKSVANRNLPRPATPDAEGTASQTPLHVLLAEDDEAVRKVLTRQMEQCGMTVTATASSTEAEQAFRVKGPFDVIVSDIVMPGELHGPALIKRLRESQVDLPAVLLSGYPQAMTTHGQGLGPDDVMLMKPVTRDNLRTAIIDAMRARRA